MDAPRPEANCAVSMVGQYGCKRVAVERGMAICVTDRPADEATEEVSAGTTVELTAASMPEEDSASC